MTAADLHFFNHLFLSSSTLLIKDPEFLSLVVVAARSYRAFFDSGLL